MNCDKFASEADTS